MSQKDILGLLLNGIRTRRWDTIKEQWIKYIPDIDPPGAPSKILISDVEEFKSWAKTLASAPTELSIRADIAGLRSLALWEAFFYFIKHLTF